MNAGDGCLNEVLRCPGRFGTADLQGKVPQNIRAGLGVVDLGMELHGPHFPLGRFNGSNRAGRAGHQPETCGELYGFVAVGHPDGKFHGQALEQT